MIDRRYSRRRPPLKRRNSLDHLGLAEVGLGTGAQLFIFGIALFPLVGIVLGSYYASQDHYATRSFGRLVLAFAAILQFLYFCILCPTLFYLVLT